MKKVILLMIVSIFILSCGDDAKNSCDSNPCKDKLNTHCVIEKDSFTCMCDDNYKLDNEVCIFDCTSKEHSHTNEENTGCICDDNYKLNNNICELNCNLSKEKSDIILNADSCGELTECNSNLDCAANERCENLKIKNENFNKGCCVVGLRGCQTVGTECVDEYDCDTALCIGRKDEQSYCTKVCDPENNTCPSPITACTYMFVYDACTEPKE